MSTKYMQGFDFIPSGAVSADYVPIMQADGMYGGVDGLAFLPGRFGIGTAMTPTDRPGGCDVYQAFMHTFGNGYVFGMALKLGPSQYGGFTASVGAFFRIRSAQLDLDDLGVEFASQGIINFVLPGGVTYRSKTGAIRGNAWFYLQVKRLPGFFEVKVNGEVVVHVTVGVPAVQPVDSLYQHQGFSSGRIFYDDMYFNDPTDGGNTDYLGNITVRSQTVIGNGDHLDLTPVGQGTNYLNANNYRLPATDYNYTSVIGDYDLYHANPNVAARDVFALQVKGLYYQDNGIQLYGANQFLIGIDGGTLQTGAPGGLNQEAPGSINDYWDKNPDTGLPFTTNQLNNLQIGPLLQGSD